VSSAGADGSAMLETGNTRVAASVRGPREVVSGTQTGVVVTVSYAAFAGSDRRRTDHRDRRAVEVAAQLEAALNAVVQTALFPRSRVDVMAHVLQTDGAVPAVCFNACVLALVDAGVPVVDMCAACSVGVVDRTPLLDPIHAEVTSGGGAELWVSCLSRSGGVVSAQLAGRVAPATLRELVRQAQLGCAELNQVLGAFVRDAVQEQMQATEFLEA